MKILLMWFFGLFLVMNCCGSVVVRCWMIVCDRFLVVV